MHRAAHLQRVQYRQWFVHAHIHALLGIPLSLDQGQMQRATGTVAERMRRELAKGGVQRPCAHLLHQAFSAAAVFNQVGNGADLQAMLGRKQLQVRQAGHRAVILHDFADDGGRCATGHGRQIAARFGVAGAHQHATFHGLQGKDVPGLDQVIGLRLGGYRHLHGAGTVGGRDTGGHAFGGLDRHREGGAHLGAVARHHGRQLQPLAALLGQRQADQAATEACHEVDGFGGDMVGGQHQVAFVLAVFLVHQDHNAAGPHVGNDVLHGGDGHRGQGLGRVHAVSLVGV